MHAGRIKGHDFGRVGHLPRLHRRTDRAAANLDNHLHRQIQPALNRNRVNAALKAIARIAVYIMVASRQGNGDRLKPSAFNQHILCVQCRAALQPAHNAGQPQYAALIGNHAIAVAQFISFLIKRDKAFAVFGLPRAHRAGQLIGIINMQRTTAIIGNIIGDIDQRINRLQPDGVEPRFQPSRAFSVFNALNAASGKKRAGVADNCNFSAAVFLALNRLRRVVFQRAETGGGQIARNAAHAQAIRAVGRNANLNHRVIQAQRLGGGRADFRRIGKLDNAVMVVR